ncbi:MAG: hypothetical protein RM368_26970 [Nostoc sp. DedSLP03]|nr:hypothetical protein [Nostoc sp. DedSLP03]MDZ7968552.1 hypothetical protein [Nostoc sp. DedSLP03]
MSRLEESDRYYAYNESQQIVSAIFPEVALTVEQVLAAGNVG